MKIHTTYNDFLNEGKNEPVPYDGAWSKEKDPYDKDLRINVGNKLPGGNKAWDKTVKKYEIIELDANGQPKWMIKFKNGDVMIAQRYNRFGNYKVKYNKKDYDTAYVGNLGYDLMKSLLSPMEQYEQQIQAVDWWSGYADDFSKYKSGNAHKETIRTIYSELKGGEKRKAYKLHTKHAPKDYQYSDFEKFDAAGGR